MPVPVKICSKWTSSGPETFTSTRNMCQPRSGTFWTRVTLQKDRFQNDSARTVVFLVTTSMVHSLVTQLSSICIWTHRHRCTGLADHGILRHFWHFLQLTRPSACTGFERRASASTSFPRLLYLYLSSQAVHPRSCQGSWLLPVGPPVAAGREFPARAQHGSIPGSPFTHDELV